MSILLSLETATTVCSVAIHKDGVLLSLRELDSDKSHSQVLLQFIEELLEEHKLSKKDLNGLVISEGPGSYTGLRIGLSTAKGLCFALDIPLIAVNTIDALGYQVSKNLRENELACPMIDARRMEVYTAIYNNKNIRVEALNNVIIDENSFDSYLKNQVINFFGNGSDKCKEILKHENAHFIENIKPTATTIGELGYLKFQKKEFVDTAYFEPNYFKEFYTPPAKNKTLLNLVKKS